MRVRTASAACRSVSPSPYCMRVTRASRHGASAGCPRLGNRSWKSLSSDNVPSSSRICIHTLPSGRTACARRTVSSGIAGVGWGCMDIDSLLVLWTLSFFQYLIFLLDPALRIRQQYLSGVVPYFSLNEKKSKNQKGFVALLIIKDVWLT